MNLVDAFRFRNCEVVVKPGRLINNKPTKVRILKSVSPKCVNELGELTLPNVDVVDFNALSQVKDLIKTLNIPKSVCVFETEGYLYPFSYLDNLQNVNVDSDNKIFYVDNYNRVYKKLLPQEDFVSVLTMPTKEDFAKASSKKVELLFDGSKNQVYTAPQNFEKLIINNGAFFPNLRIKRAEFNLQENATVQINPARDSGYSDLNEILVNGNPVNLIDYVTNGNLVCEFSRKNNSTNVTYVPLSYDFEEMFINSNKITVPLSKQPQLKK